jgi:hypothetical protein
MATTFTTDAIHLQGEHPGAMQYKVANTDAVGSLQVQGSVDPDNFGWVDLGSAVAISTGVSSTDLVNLFGLYLPFVRFSYTRSSGTGTFTWKARIRGAK